MSTRRPAPAPEPRRRPIPDAAAAELKRRYLARQAADQQVSDFLAGVVLGLDLAPAEVVGFDDTTGELLLSPEP